MNRYRTAFYLVLIGDLVLLAGLGGWWWWRTHAKPRPPAMPAGMAMPASTPAAPASSGEAASAGPKLAPIQLSPQRLQSIGVEVGVAERKDVEDDLRLVGNVAVDERHQSYVQTRFSGWIQKVFANANFQYVKKGQPLFTIYSRGLVTTEREYLLARQNEALLAQSTVPGVAAGASSLVRATLERLRQWNLPEREIARLQTTGKVRQDFEIDAPVSGFITQRNALPNMYVQPATQLYTVADFSTVWVDAQVYQNDLGRIRVGDPAALTVDTYPGRKFRGRVDFIYPEVDTATRTSRVRLVFRNPRLLLRPGMFVNVDLKIPMGRQLVVPAGAVFQAGTQQVAFIDRGQGYLQPRPVVAGPQVGNFYIVLKGLRAGDRVVTSANFLIDSESQLQAAMGSFLPPAPVAPTAGAAQPQLQFSTQPAPPRVGTNAFRVKLTDAHGQGIADARVQVVFFLPAMPDMGMSAQKAVFTLTSQGGGVYGGTGQIPGGGNWQVSVVARRGGTVIASKQLSVSTGGGM